ncbi:MAG: hypothetical protein ACKV2O_03400 [Acidimicrobiales bacterium]
MNSISFTSRTARTARTARTMVALAAAGVTLLGSTAVAVAHDGGGDHGGGLTRAQREVITEATRAFRDPAAAVAAGYIPSTDCVAAPGLGGMGYHYVNPTLLGDNRIDPTRPEILVYHHARNGKLRLGAVEYFAADADQDKGTAADRPTLMGHEFEGPMDGHGPGMPVHYDLHAWVFTENPSGELAGFNPSVSCPTP